MLEKLLMVRAGPVPVETFRIEQNEETAVQVKIFAGPKCALKCLADCHFFLPRIVKKKKNPLLLCHQIRNGTPQGAVLSYRRH